MKKVIVLGVIISSAALQFCSPAKKMAVADTKVSYANHLQPAIQGNCSPCHIAGQGKATALNNYDAAKLKIDDIITRIKKSPTEKGFMPLRHPKLADSTISIFEKWKAGGFGV
jgi:mono/diheme cytochrome c family protein